MPFPSLGCIIARKKTGQKYLGRYHASLLLHRHVLYRTYRRSLLAVNRRSAATCKFGRGATLLHGCCTGRRHNTPPLTPFRTTCVECGGLAMWESHPLAAAALLPAPEGCHYVCWSPPPPGRQLPRCCIYTCFPGERLAAECSNH